MKKALLIIGGILIVMLGLIFKSANASGPQSAGFVMMAAGCIMTYAGISGNKNKSGNNQNPNQ